MANHANAQRTLTEPGRPGGLVAVGADVATAHRETSIMFERRGSGMVQEVVEDDPSVAGRLAWLAARLTIRPALAIGSHLANVPWPWGLVDFAARAVTPAPGSVPMVPEADRSLRQIGNYIREVTERKATPPVVQGYHRGSCRGVVADFASNWLPPSTIHRRTGDC